MEKDLTNEKLLKRFKSQFKLVGHAIGLAEHMVLAGKGGRTDNQNIALEVIAELDDEEADPSDLREFFRKDTIFIDETFEPISTH